MENRETENSFTFISVSNSTNNNSKIEIDPLAIAKLKAQRLEALKNKKTNFIRKNMEALSRKDMKNRQVPWK